MVNDRQRRHNDITTTTNNNNTTPPSSLPHISATLDLHGYRRDEAKPRIASFLEQHDGWVLIVTGTGQHSHDGPVLRDYVASLLQRRQMQHFLHPQNRGKLCGVGIVRCCVPAIGGTGGQQGADCGSRDGCNEGQSCTTGGTTDTSVAAAFTEQSVTVGRVGIWK